MDQKPQRWEELAALAAQEQDPKKLMELIQEINALLDTKQKPPFRLPKAASE